jgi:anti-sigma regulatory factor (Ser/Thr protein kinase)
MPGGIGAGTADCGGAHLSRSAHDSGAGTDSNSWPLQAHLSLGALPSAVSCARGLARSVAHEWDLPDLADTAELLTSELVTNAIQASERLGTTEIPVIQLWLVRDGGSMVIHVWDAHPCMPVLRESATDEENGRGLMLVAALGKDWGAYRKAEGGKVAWVMISPDL